MEKEITIYTRFQYNEETRMKWYTDKKGRTALCFTCAYDGYCGKKMRYTKCKDYIRRNDGENASK